MTRTALPSRVRAIITVTVPPPGADHKARKIEAMLQGVLCRLRGDHITVDFETHVGWEVHDGQSEVVARPDAVTSPDTGGSAGSSLPKRRAAARQVGHIKPKAKTTKVRRHRQGLHSVGEGNKAARRLGRGT